MTKEIPRFFSVILLVVSFLGFINAVYLAWIASLGLSPTCFLNSGCDIVAASPYSKVAGIPLSLFGVFFYFVIMGFSLFAVINPRARVLPFILPLSFLGFLLSLYFLYLQMFVIRAYCEYCLFSLFDATIIFFLSLFLLVHLRGKKEKE